MPFIFETCLREISLVRRLPSRKGSLGLTPRLPLYVWE
jgi:hypothetical protein